ncbi:hypothetical protein [Glaciimonas immobilis]|uniref:Uncharacterized protein n=1 Tax=Glaciimonas immobilis TaxID=728004 RepID=A0A840RUL7_9BURK|nr:hypothetical protein [Glaciimonas immobilis]KAF3997466.1 hypothetical protein HAV38_12345 [Glaciimonas immobilis]MBB5200862.1 hypothetical protein [Glaciimonas immobilis]
MSDVQGHDQRWMGIRWIVVAVVAFGGLPRLTTQGLTLLHHADNCSLAAVTLSFVFFHTHFSQS